MSRPKVGCEAHGDSPNERPDNGGNEEHGNDQRMFELALEEVTRLRINV